VFNMVATNTNTNTNTTELAPPQTNNTANWILAGASAISAINSGLQYRRGADLANNIPDVSGMQKTSAARQDVLAGRLMMPQGLTDTQFNRSERALTEQAGGLIANVTAQARDVLANSPLVFEAMVKQAVDKAVSVQKSGMEKLNLYDVETVLGNAQAAITATQNSSITQERITEQQRQVEKERRELDEARNKAFADSMMSLSKALGIAFSGMGPTNGDAVAENETITGTDPVERTPLMTETENALAQKTTQDDIAEFSAEKEAEAEKYKAQALKEEKTKESEANKQFLKKAEATKTIEKFTPKRKEEIEGFIKVGFSEEQAIARTMPGNTSLKTEVNKPKELTWEQLLKEVEKEQELWRVQ